ncbi:MAG TPA: ATP-binding cassette domain-containing protein [Acidimicrobiales bacterium]|nr:ATP-binding cassette domain-containing protein [Acidimicrobiales bacterium]
MSAPAAEPAGAWRGRWPLPYRKHHYATLVAFVAVVIVVMQVIVNDPSNQHLINLWLVESIAAVGFYLVFCLAGRFAFSQTLMMALGAYTSAYVGLKYGFWTGFVLGMLVVLAFSLVVALALSRVQEFYFAIATLALTDIGIQVFNNWTAFAGPSGTQGGLPPPSFFGLTLITDPQVFWMLLAALALALLVAIVIERSPVRRKAVAARDLPTVARFNGTRLLPVQVGLFVVGSALGGLSGILLAGWQSTVSSQSFGVQLAIGIFVMVILGGVGSVWGSVIGALFVVFVPDKLQFLSNYTSVVYGVVLVVGIILLPRGVVGIWDRLKSLAAGALGWDREPTVGGRGVRAQLDVLANSLRELASRALAFRAVAAAGGRRHGVAATTGAAGPGGPGGPGATTGGVGGGVGGGGAGGAPAMLFEGRDISVHFGGVAAVDGVGFGVSRAGEVVGLVGPNGSGKSTFLNATCGLVPSQGQVLVRGATMDRRRLTELSRTGVGRTFQTPQVFTELSCAENVLLGSQDRQGTGLAAAFLRRPTMWRAERRRMAAAEQALADVGLAGFGQRPADSLSYGQQRLVELARCLVGQPFVLLLDEPSAGLNDAETAALGQILQSLRRAGMGMILVDHKVAFVDSLCDRLVVLQVGRMIAQGPPAEVWAHPEVINAYLGTA